MSFALEAGEMLALIGPNGAGKSTCFNMINGQIAPTRGRDHACSGRRTDGLTPRAIWRLGVGRTFQITATFASMTVRENIQMALLVARIGAVWPALRWAARYRRDEAARLLRTRRHGRSGGTPLRRTRLWRLKRLELAVALANEPRLLLMDEPTAGMAPSERHELMALAARIARERTIGVLFTEHDMDVVFGHADRVLVLNRGELIAEGAPAEVRARADVRAVYLGAGVLYGAERAIAVPSSSPFETSTPPTAARTSCSTSRSTSAAGEAVALLGRNGAGKSTTFRAIVGLVANRAAARSFRRRGISAAADPRHRAPRPRLCAGGPAHLRRPDGRRKSRGRPPAAARRARRHGRAERLFALFPNLARIARAARARA